MSDLAAVLRAHWLWSAGSTYWKCACQRGDAERRHGGVRYEDGVEAWLDHVTQILAAQAVPVRVPSKTRLRQIAREGD